MCVPTVRRGRVLRSDTFCTSSTLERVFSWDSWWIALECLVFARRFSWTSSLGTLGDRSPSDSSSLLEDCGRDISSPGTLVNWFGVLKEEARVRSTVFVRRNVWCLSVAMHQGLRKYSLLKNKLQDAEGDDEESIIEVRSFYHR